MLSIWSLACLFWVATAAGRNEKPNVVIMLMDDVSCGKFYPGNFQTMQELMLAYLLALSALIFFYFSPLNPLEGVMRAVFLLV